MIEILKLRRRILLVDQDLDLRVGLGLMLKSAGFEVQQASDGMEAIAMHRRQAFDLIVTEIQMPGTDGLDILCTLSSQLAAPKFVFLSRQSRVPAEAFLRITRHLGTQHVLCKPFSPEHLLATVREVLGEE